MQTRVRVLVDLYIFLVLSMGLFCSIICSFHFLRMYPGKMHGLMEFKYGAKLVHVSASFLIKWKV